MNVAVIGAGKLGIPMAVYMAMKAEHNLVLIDKDREKVEKINNGILPFFDLSKELYSLLKKHTNSKQIIATDSFAILSKVDVAIVIVPLILNQEKDPDFEALDYVTDKITQNLKDQALVIYETTMPVGTVRKRFAQKLRKDLYVGYSPERVYMGRVLKDLKKYPKLIGGIDERSSEKLKNFYKLYFKEIIDMGSVENAEMAKLSEAVYRDVNIALANTLALYAEKFNCDFSKIINACNTQPFSHLHKPGIYVGGHCIPVYPHLLLYGENNPQESFIGKAREINENMPFISLKRILKELNQTPDKLTFAILGLSFREGSKEIINSGAFKLIEYLKFLEVKKIYLHDALFNEEEIAKYNCIPFTFNEEVDCVIIHTAHKEYLALKDQSFKIQPKLIFDGRGILNKNQFHKIKLMQIGVGKR